MTARSWCGSCLGGRGARAFQPLCQDRRHRHEALRLQLGREREIQRTMLELLNQLDGIDSRGDVKVVMATNRRDPGPGADQTGQIDRKIEFPLPDEKTKRRTSSRSTQPHDAGRRRHSQDELIPGQGRSERGGYQGHSCTEGGLMALRERRMRVTNEDLKLRRACCTARRHSRGPVFGRAPDMAAGAITTHSHTDIHTCPAPAPALLSAAAQTNYSSTSRRVGLCVTVLRWC